MKDKTYKLNCVQNTLKVCKELAKDNKERSEYWTNEGNKDMAFTCEMLESAYSFIAQLLETDLSDKE